MNPTPFPSPVAIQTGRGTSPAGGKGDPAAFHIPGAAHIAAGSHYTQTVSLARARLDGWRPCRICFGGTTADSPPETLTNAELRRWLPPADAPAETIERTVFERVRSKDVVEWTRRRSGHRCEMPGCTAPLFLTDAGEPYVEVHHLDLLAEDGADHPTNTAALCPACHRRLHFGADRVEALAKLRAYVAVAQAAFEATA